MIGNSLDMDQSVFQPAAARGSPERAPLTEEQVRFSLSDYAIWPHPIRTSNLDAVALEPPCQNGNTQEQPAAVARLIC